MKRKISVLVTVVLLLLVALYGAAEYMLAYALTPAPRLTRSEYIDDAGTRNPAFKEWIDSIDGNGLLRDTFLLVDEDVRLHAYLLPAPRPTTHTAILLHGYTNHALRHLALVNLYHQSLGFNVLAPDFYAHGLSDGKAIRMGWLDRLDMKRWVKVAQDYFHSDTIVMHGISMGAATTMMLSGEDDVPVAVRAYIEDCGYTSVWDEFAEQMHQQFHLPAFPVLYAANALCKYRYGWSFDEASALKQVQKCDRPMFFIHGVEDTFVPFDMMPELYNAKPEPKDYWMVEGTKHAKAQSNAPLEYRSMVINFLQKHKVIQ